MGVAKAVLFSSRAVYGAHQTFADPIDEAYGPEPDTLYGKLKWEAEQLVSRQSNPQFMLTALRPTGVYGGGRDINKWTPLFQAALKGAFPKTNRASTEVHGQTVADAVALILSDQTGKFAGQTLNLSEVTTTTAEILNAAGMKTPPMPPLTPKGPNTGKWENRAFGSQIAYGRMFKTKRR